MFGHNCWYIYAISFLSTEHFCVVISGNYFSICKLKLFNVQGDIDIFLSYYKSNVNLELKNYFFLHCFSSIWKSNNIIDIFWNGSSISFVILNGIFSHWTIFNGGIWRAVIMKLEVLNDCSIFNFTTFPTCGCNVFFWKIFVWICLISRETLQ